MMSSSSASEGGRPSAAAKMRSAPKRSMLISSFLLSDDISSTPAQKCTVKLVFASSTSVAGGLRPSVACSAALFAERRHLLHACNEAPRLIVHINFSGVGGWSSPKRSTLSSSFLLSGAISAMPVRGNKRCFWVRAISLVSMVPRLRLRDSGPVVTVVCAIVGICAFSR